MYEAGAPVPRRAGYQRWIVMGRARIERDVARLESTKRRTSVPTAYAPVGDGSGVRAVHDGCAAVRAGTTASASPAAANVRIHPLQVFM